MPSEEAFCGESLSAVARRVEHHVHDTLNMAVNGCERADVHTQTAGNGRTHRSYIQVFALDLAGPEYVIRQCSQAGLAAQA
ncbi:hypothetical protein C666_17935 [Thauera linaloolentis 47Lol = DSM 12138]|uniref:Uncharacterized protein n=1 Tax=Thauera linaloolentis (strain DSM 12138 / JCM 21573 / CCUG 41526 / CIP 105981 / IAM 15112 / NBRC 102519 / 47Lol) TaxID=1123367 RepID=N6YVU8_THAL4|nr:hypothetical protein C666_17935 [Thauera linaloolentis 47Lol = DSM 12138]